MSTKTELIADLDQAREVMRMLLRDLEAKHMDNMELYPTWTIKELLSHITGWDDASIASLHAHVVGDVPATPAARGIDPYNASTVHEREALSLDRVIAEWEQTRTIFKETVNALPEDKVNEPFVFPWGEKGTVEQLVEIFVEHEEGHANEIREKLLV